MNNNCALLKIHLVVWGTASNNKNHHVWVSRGNQQTQVHVKIAVKTVSVCCLWLFQYSSNVNSQISVHNWIRWAASASADGRKRRPFWLALKAALLPHLCRCFLVVCFVNFLIWVVGDDVVSDVIVTKWHVDEWLTMQLHSHCHYRPSCDRLVVLTFHWHQQETSWCTTDSVRNAPLLPHTE